MNIKSLLIGSAAALVAVSGARAADAVVAEPEAVEYVRVCDAYGAGFFYIPGTETCLKIGGHVRYRIDFGPNEDDGIEEDNGWRKQASAMLNFTASSDTEMGTLTSYIEMSATQESGDFDEDGKWGLDHAWISLGGLKMGYSDTAFDGSINGEFDSFGGATVHFIGYTFSGDGFSATLNLEEADYNFDYMPNIVAKASYTAGSLTATGFVAYDATAEEFALKAIVSAGIGEAGTLQVGAQYNSGANIYDADGYDWSVGASYMHKLNDKLSITAGAQYEDFGAGDTWLIGAHVDYTIVPNFAVKAVVNYNTASEDVSGWLRFERDRKSVV